uniref:Reverse transcriptase domain-containing protein n=3 Tax=Aegilops tauschii subsp. strangulata TaxID=200361 RepID=A0A452YCL7_AEGTS
MTTSTSSFLLNGAAGKKILHCRGLRQGPLSPLLFIIAIDPLHRLLQRAMELGQLDPIPGRDLALRVSLYADDVIIFANPVKEEIDTLMSIIHDFGLASGLKVNLQKSSVAAIRCDQINLQQVLQSFGGQQARFPLRCLGLPVTISRLRIVHLQFILDRIRARLGWKGRLLTIAGRRVLVRSVLSALSTFALTVLKVPKKLLAEVDKIRRRLLWAQDEAISGGKCKVSWPEVCTPIDNGGLGISNLQRFSRALRLRWLWLSWLTPNRPWVGMQLPCDQGDRELFNASTTVTLGDGKTASFWDSSWAGAGTLKMEFPELHKHSKRKNRTVHAALHDDTWVTDLAHGQTQQLWPEVIRLNRWLISKNISLSDQEQDTIKWKHTASGSFSTSSAYNCQFQRDAQD